MRSISIVLSSVGVFFGIITAEAAECPSNRNAIGTRHVISIELTKHARLGCMQKYQRYVAIWQNQKHTRQAKARQPKLSIFMVGRPVPKGGGIYRIGNPYVRAGRTYTPQDDPNYRAEGRASWYGKEFHGRLTANGEIFDANALSAAHPTLPLPSYVRVTNLQNHRSLVVRLNDRGPFHGHRLIDVSVRAAKLLGFYDQGLAQVRVEYLSRAELEGSDNDRLAATLRQEGPSAMPVAANAPIRPNTSDPSPVDRELIQPQCGRPPSTTMYPLSVNFNGDRVDGVNCKPTIFETKIAVSLLPAFRRRFYCVPDHAAD